jgi:hypothetical protein
MLSLCLAPTRNMRKRKAEGLWPASLLFGNPLADVRQSTCYPGFSRGRTIMFNLKKISSAGLKLFILWHVANFAIGLLLAAFVFVPAMIH